MDQSEGWGRSRYVTLIVVIGVHVGLVAALMRASRAQLGALSTEQPVELLFFPPTTAPKVRPENFRPKRLSGDTVITMAPPEFDSVAPSAASDPSATNGNGSGVDWKAEARRALQAYEIRNRLPQSDNSLSGSPAEETWWPQARRRAGMPFKTAGGDWIVWINSNCSQVATSEGNAYTLGAMLPQTVCESTRHSTTN